MALLRSADSSDVADHGSPPVLRSRNHEKREKREDAKRVVLIAGLKGGEGKSTFARVLIELIRRFLGGGLAVAAADGDLDVGQTSSFLAERDGQGSPFGEQNVFSGVVGFDFLGEDDARTYATLVAHDAERVVIDLPAGSMKRVIAPTAMIDADRFIDQMESLGKRVTIIHILSPMLASLNGLDDVVRAFGDRVDHIAVRNLARGKPDDFVIWAGGNAWPDWTNPGRNVRTRFEAAGGTEIDFPALPAGTYALIDAFQISFADALERFRNDWVHRANLQGWLIKVAHQIDRVRPQLGLPLDAEWKL